MLRRILVPVDSISWDNTLNAIEYALDLSSGCKQGEIPELIFLHVIHIKERIPYHEHGKIREMEKRKLEEEFECIKEMCNQKGLENFRTVIKEGTPEDEIIESCREERVDLVIMGSGKLKDRSARGRIHKFLYGSVTEKVIHKAPCSVFIVRP